MQILLHERPRALQVQALEDELRRQIAAEGLQRAREVRLPQLPRVVPVQRAEGLRRTAEMLLHEIVEVCKDLGTFCIQLLDGNVAAFVLIEGLVEEPDVSSPANVGASLKQLRLLQDHDAFRAEHFAPCPDIVPVLALQEALEVAERGVGGFPVVGDLAGGLQSGAPLGLLLALLTALFNLKPLQLLRSDPLTVINVERMKKHRLVPPIPTNLL
mmetsp:Transcript_133466/g.333167  ORF Transcript_133466/g.333167 Transcript_133466/m.333167 type:complete len:214 (-) Transcript_133466:496-1137(-)